MSNTKNEIKRAIEFGNLRYKVFCYIAQKLGYSNHMLHTLEVRNKVYHYVKNHYGSIADDYVHCGEIVSNNRDVWICWLQGVENSPSIVKRCVESASYWLSDKNINIIDESNLHNYIDLPDYILEKWHKGIISNTLFSDFIRLSVLKRFGGLWLDATVFFSGPLPGYIEDSDIFMYKTPIEDEAKLGESWLIKAPSNSPLICLTLDLLCEYWKHEEKIRDYFIMFICMKIAAEKVGSPWPRTIEIPNRLPQMLERCMNDDFNLAKWNYINKLTSIHKLNYKRIDDNEKSFVSNVVLTANNKLNEVNNET